MRLVLFILKKNLIQFFYSREQIQKPPRNRSKGVRNQRIKSVIEKKFNQAKDRRKIAQMAAIQTKIVVQASV